MDTGDLLGLLCRWGQQTDECDVTGDGFVNVADLLAMLSSWGVCN